MKDKISFSTKNKEQKNKKNRIDIYKVNKLNLNNRLSDNKICKKTFTSSSTSYRHKNNAISTKNLKPVFSYRDTLNKMHIKLNKILHSYNMSNDDLNKKIINNIIFDSKKRIVSVFKDYLLWYETSDFFKLYYKMNKSSRLMRRFINYYDAYTQFYPEYGPLEDILKILTKNIKRKKKYMERVEDEEAHKFNKNEEKFERYIKDSEIKVSETNSKILDNNLVENNSKNTLYLSSLEKENTQNLVNNKDLSSILNHINEYDDKSLDKKRIDYSNIIDYNNNDNSDINILIFHSKFHKFYEEKLKDERTKNINKNNNTSLNKNLKKKTNKQNVNILNNIIHKEKRTKSKEEKNKKFLENYNNSQRKKINNPLLKNIKPITKRDINLKLYKSKANSRIKRYNTSRHLRNNIAFKLKPQNIKKIFNSFNKHENNLKNNNNIYSFRNIKGNKLKQKCLTGINNSPLYLKGNKNNLILNILKTKRKFKINNILNLEKIKNTSHMYSVKNTHRSNNNSELENDKNQIHNNTNINMHIKLKSSNFSKQISKGLNFVKIINSERKNNQIQISKQNSSKKRIDKLSKKYKKIKYNIKNPFRSDAISIFNNTINHNSFSNSILISNKLYSKQKRILSLLNDDNIYKDDINNKNNLIKTKNLKNNLILSTSNIIKIIKNDLAHSFKKKNKIMKSKISSSEKRNKNKDLIKKDSNKYTGTFTKLNNIKNNILKKVIDKSHSKNDLNLIPLKKHASLLKTCFSNFSKDYFKKKRNLKLDELDKLDINNTNLIKKKFLLYNLTENIFLKNTIKKKSEININKNGCKKPRICLKLPLLYNVSKI